MNTGHRRQCRRQRGTFGKSASAGRGGFGSSSARRAPLERDERAEVPGPGAYGNALKPSNSVNRAGSAFASKSTRMAPVRHTDTPAVGAYDAAAASSLASGASRTHNKKSGSFGTKAVRNVNATPREAAEAPGPGAYEQSGNTFARSTAGTRGQMSSVFASNSLSTRDSFLGL